MCRESSMAGATDELGKTRPWWRADSKNGGSHSSADRHGWSAPGAAKTRHRQRGGLSQHAAWRQNPSPIPTAASGHLFCRPPCSPSLGIADQIAAKSRKSARTAVGRARSPAGRCSRARAENRLPAGQRVDPHPRGDFCWVRFPAELQPGFFVRGSAHRQPSAQAEAATAIDKISWPRRRRRR